MTTANLLLSNQETIHYYQSGTDHKNIKETLLFIHGNFSNWGWWKETIDIMEKKNYHIIAVDLRGFGLSSFNSQCHRFGDWALDLVDFLKIKQVKKCIAIGWSFGGGVSMKLAQLIPQIIHKIILTCSVSHEGLSLFNKEVPCNTYQTIKENGKVKFMQSVIESKNKEALKQIFQSVLLTHAKEFPIEKYQPMMDGSLQQKCYINVMHALANTDINIKSIKAEALVIHGKNDFVVTLDSVRSMGQHFKNFIIWQNNAHMIPVQNSIGYADLITEFAVKK